MHRHLLHNCAPCYFHTELQVCKLHISPHRHRLARPNLQIMSGMCRFSPKALEFCVNTVQDFFVKQHVMFSEVKIYISVCLLKNMLTLTWPINTSLNSLSSFIPKVNVGRSENKRLHLNLLKEHWWGVNISPLICRNSKKRSFHNLNMFADVFNYLSSCSALLYGGGVDCMFAGN